MKSLLPFAALALALAACTSSNEDAPKTEDQYRDAAVQGMHDALLQDVTTMSAAAIDLRHAAPLPSNRGWDASLDADAVAAMKDAWTRARTAYEHVEGALAPLFPDIDVSIDARYDDFMTILAADGGDHDLFDDRGVTGMHAVERILYSDVTPARVVDFEKSLPGYEAARFPATADEASEFSNKLCSKLISDAAMLHEQWTPANIDAAIAFQGLISLMNEQREKVQKAASNEEESRYSQRTMADLRDNLEGSKTVYAAFRPWILSKPDGEAIDAKIAKGLSDLDEAYRGVEGDSIPAPPVTWSAEAPTRADLDSPFGKLYTSVFASVDPASGDSVVAQLNQAASTLGFPEFQVAQ